MVLSSDRLDDHDMVCDFKAVKLAVAEFLDQYDHAMMINSDDAFLPALQQASERVIVFDHVDPTTEVLAKTIFDYISTRVAERGANDGFTFPQGVIVERVRVWETSTSWAEYGNS